MAEFAVWKLRPGLITNYGDIDARTIEVWLPFPDSETEFQDLKDFEATERSRYSPWIPNGLTVINQSNMEDTR